MTEQSGPRDPSERPGTERPGTERPGTERPGQSGRAQGAAGHRAVQAESPAPRRPRWRSEPLAHPAGCQERAEGDRRTGSPDLGGGRSSPADVWDTVTNEIPPEVGEAPECQWCPICRAARRMRDSGPGIGGQLSGAGEAVASAVQDAFSALDGLLAKTSGGNAQRDREPRGTSPHATEPRQIEPPGLSRDRAARDRAARDRAARDRAARDWARDRRARANQPRRAARLARRLSGAL